MEFCLPYAAQLRAKGISTEIFPDASKLKKQMGYANSKSIPFVVMAGEDEVNTQTLTVRNMLTGEQNKVPAERLSDLF